MSEEEKSTILIVDDTPANLAVLVDFLEAVDCKVVVAEDGEDALEIINYSLPDVILLDIMMPGIDGFETCRRLKENDRTKDIPVIFISALNETVDKVKGLLTGAVDFITKPFQNEEVLARVSTHINLRKVQAQVLAAELEIKSRDAMDEAKNDFLSLINDEIRRPLNVITGFSDMLKETELSDYQEDCLNGIMDSGKSLSLTINNILHLMKESDASNYRRESRVQLEPHLSFLAKTFEEEAKKKGLDFDVSISPIGAETIQANGALLRKLFSQLISNAIQYTDKGTVSVSLDCLNTVQVEGKTEWKYLFKVKDTGIGIPLNEHQNVFKPFYQLNKKDSSAGTGLGLAIVKRFCDLIEATVELNSKPGEGTEVFVYFQFPEA